MNIVCEFKYQEGYLPTSRHKIMRYRDVVASHEVPIGETTKADAPVAFVVTEALKKSYEIRQYHDEIFARALNRSGDVFATLEAFKDNLDEVCNYPRWTSDSKEDAINSITDEISKYLLIDNEVWRRINEPVYTICTFGLGRNHGGTGFFVEKHVIGSGQICFNALEREAALKYANEVALERGDTDSVNRLGTSCNIEVLIPEAVKCPPNAVQVRDSLNAYIKDSLGYKNYPNKFIDAVVDEVLLAGGHCWEVKEVLEKLLIEAVEKQYK